MSLRSYPPKPNLRSHSSSSTAHQPPCPLPSPPQPIPQTKISKSYCNLIQIPLPQYPSNFKQLYLSHNSIRSVKGKLSHFKALKNLNLSYNLLTDVGEIIDEINGRQMCLDSSKHESTPINLKMLYIRMNNFPYGFEDELIKNLSSLQKFQEYSLRPHQTKALFSLANKISEYLLPAYSTLTKATIELLKIMQDGNTSESVNKYQKFVGQVWRKVTNMGKRKSKYLAKDRNKELEQIMELLLICLELNVQEPKDYVDQSKTKFKEVVRQILMRFNMRNHHQLRTTIESFIPQQFNTSQPTNTCQSPVFTHSNLQAVCSIFGNLYNAHKYNINEPNPARYIQKLPAKLLQNHPFAQYIEETRGNRYGDMMTLDGDRRRTINTIRKDFKQFKNEKDSDDDSLDNMQGNLQTDLETSFFQKIPVFVFERNYIQVLREILQQKIGQFLRVFDSVVRRTQSFSKMTSNQIEQKHHKKQAKIDQDTLHNNFQSVSFKDPSDFISQSNFEPKEKQKLIENSAPKIILTEQKVDGKRKQNKSQNKKKQISQNDQNDDEEKRKTVILQKNIKQRKDSLKTAEYQKTKKRKEREKKYEQVSDFKLEEQNLSEISQNLQKFSFYEINLAYKVLTALKKNKNKQKRKKQKNQKQMMMEN